MLLELEDIRQSGPHDCGEAVARTVFRFHGARGKKPRASPIDGTDPRTLETSLWLAGLSVQAGSMDLDDLRHHTRKGRPVICLVTEPGGGGHWCVVAGVNRGWVAFQCPLDGLCRQRAAAFEERWQDIDRLGVRYCRWGIATGEYGRRPDPAHPDEPPGGGPPAGHGGPPAVAEVAGGGARAPQARTRVPRGAGRGTTSTCITASPTTLTVRGSSTRRIW